MRREVKPRRDSFSREHKRMLLRDAVLAAFVGIAVALLPFWIEAEAADYIVIWSGTFLLSYGYIIATDKGIEYLLKEEKRNADAWKN